MDDPEFLRKHFLESLFSQTFEPSFDGSTKRLQLRLLSSSVASERIMLVAIRGTAAMVEWLVNFNGEDEDTPFLVGSSRCL